MNSLEANQQTIKTASGSTKASIYTIKIIKFLKLMWNRNVSIFLILVSEYLILIKENLFLLKFYLALYDF